MNMVILIKVLFLVFFMVLYINKLFVWLVFCNVFIDGFGILLLYFGLCSLIVGVFLLF